MVPNDIRDMLLRLQAGELSPEEERLLLQQVADNPAWQQELDELRQLQQHLKQAQPRSDPEFATRVLHRLDERSQVGAMIVSLLPRVAAACLVALIAVTALLYYTEGSLLPEAWVGLQDLSFDEAISLTEY